MGVVRVIELNPGGSSRSGMASGFAPMPRSDQASPRVSNFEQRWPQTDTRAARFRLAPLTGNAMLGAPAERPVHCAAIRARFDGAGAECHLPEVRLAASWSEAG